MYLTVRSLDPTGKGRIRWSARWKPALNAFAITFADRWATSYPLTAAYLRGVGDAAPYRHHRKPSG